MVIDEELFKRVEKLGFINPAQWFFIKHPQLDYKSPYRVLKEGKRFEVISLIEYEENLFATRWKGYLNNTNTRV